MQVFTPAGRRRGHASLLAGLATVAIFTFAAPPAAAAPAPITTDAAEAAAGWLATQLVDGERLEHEVAGVGYPDQGLTADAALAFAAAGVAGEYGDATVAWLFTPEIRDEYLTGFGHISANAHAKLAYTATVYGLGLHESGIDLEAALRELENDQGRFVDRGSYDLSNGFSQSFAILALARTPDGAPASAVDYLVGQQCPDNGFPLLFEQEVCASDVDSTAMIVQALLAVEHPAAAEGLDWLVARQHSNGGFAGSPPTHTVNSNSTGLAAQALRAGGRHAAADAAVDYLRQRQVGCEGPAEYRGAIAYDEQGFDPSNAARTTAQAILGLAGVALADLDGTVARSEAPTLDCDRSTADPTPTSPADTGDRSGGGEETLPVTGTPVVTLIGLGVVVAAVGAVTLAVSAWLRRRSLRNLR